MSDIQTARRLADQCSAPQTKSMPDAGSLAVKAAAKLGMVRETRTCERHGDYSAIVSRIAGRQIVSKCPACSDAAAVAAQRSVVRVAAPSGVPARYAGLMPGSMAPRCEGQALALKVAARFVETLGDKEDRRGLVLYGPIGIGKTAVACSIINAANRPGFWARYVHISDLVMAVRDSYRREWGERNTSEVISDFADRPDILLLDDVGAIRLAGDVQDIILSIIEKRYSGNKRTIVTTNLPPSFPKIDESDPEKKAAAVFESVKQLLESYVGVRAADRLAGSCGLVACYGESVRRDEYLLDTARAKGSK